MTENTERIKCLILGSGPAGLTAAIYTSRADLKPVLYEGLQPGGQLTITTDVENFPGYPDGVNGTEMMEQFKRQAERFGTDIRWGLATSADLSQRPFKVIIDEEKTIIADIIIIATGSSAQWLNIESERRLNGFGVSACAICDGFFYRGLDVAVVGGGDTAAEEATYLSKICRKVHMIVRRDVLRASKAMQQRVFDTPNIEIHFNHVTKEILGEKTVNGVLMTNVKTGEDVKLDISGFFVAIGHKPNTDIFEGQLELDENGYIITKPGSTQTSVEGVFAAGDVQDHVFMQAITAAGSGCMAAIEAERSL
ncbi:MAG: thioredoxin-disulfide reductase [Bacteroidota bacterium]|nr:thioredoxin-disulfide reductase [Bacteroidota bacterium]